ncbi:MAG TPA: hypothetical protein PLL28_03475 [Chitinophagales bacterium]|nr:hypothetical protein [Chitinophagales bacterium]HMU69686.1 hypothetical protein [Chitinophagales bacterium]HMX03559.1 hypothetical protein [Chitinophagales bacterium]HMZ88198.1 hypothetical protein [Chitinophagales bacterium]HNA57188.1 hypothetical protein [Chitinophagales bacterium]
MPKRKLYTCSKGHQFYKSSDCRSCPTCASLAKPKDGLLSLLSAPARRALLQHGVESEHMLVNFSREEILSWHGIGLSAMAILDLQIKKLKLSYKISKL